MQAQQDFPAIVKVFSIGKSFQGRDIWAAKISDNVDQDEDEPEVLIDALHHAREHLTTEQALAILRWMTTGYGTDELVTRLVDTRETFLVFALNPDGMRYDLTGDPFRAWRKNRQVTSAGRRRSFTDLNRNYGYRFGCCGGSSSNPLGDDLPRAGGVLGARDPRAPRLRREPGHRRHPADPDAHHAPHQRRADPVAVRLHEDRPAPGHDGGAIASAFVGLGRAMAARNGYKAEQSSDLYITDGDQIDWLYARHRIFSFTFELYPTETPTVWGDHYPPDERIAAQTARNRSAILYLIDQAACPYAASTQAAAAVNDCGPLYDDFEIARGWRRDPGGNDTARTGMWARALPQATTALGRKQLGTVVSGQRALVTGAAAGSSPNANDLDGADDDPQPADHASTPTRPRSARSPSATFRPRRGVDRRRLPARPDPGPGRDRDDGVGGPRRAARPGRGLAGRRASIDRRLGRPDDPDRHPGRRRRAGTTWSRRRSTTCGSAGSSRTRDPGPAGRYETLGYEASGSATVNVPTRPLRRFGRPLGIAIGSGLAGAVVVPCASRSTIA